MSDDAHGDAEEKVAATTAGYGGPVSDEELAEVWLPEGEQQATSGHSDTHVVEESSGAEPNPSAPGTSTPDTVEPPD